MTLDTLKLISKQNPTAPPPQAWLALVLVCVAPMAWAQGAPVSAQACRGDAIAFCRDVRPGGGRAIACLESHREQLSCACKEALPFLGQCAQEVRKHCDKAEGATAMQACARQHAAELSPNCRAALP